MRATADGGDERALDLGASGVARMQHTTAAVRCLQCQVIVSGDVGQRGGWRIGALIKLRAHADQPGDRLARVGDQRPRRGLVHQPRARCQCVAQVEFGIVVQPNGGGKPTLRVAGVALAQRRLGHERDRQIIGQRQRDRETRDAATDDDDVIHTILCCAIICAVEG